VLLEIALIYLILKIKNSYLFNSKPNQHIIVKFYHHYLLFDSNDNKKIWRLDHQYCYDKKIKIILKIP